MGFWKSLTSWFRGTTQPHHKDVDVSSNAGRRLLEAIGFSSPPRKGDEERLESFHSSPSLYLLQHRVSDAFASVEWHVKQNGEPVDDHPVAALHAQPNPHHSGYTFRYLWQSYMDLLGECFVIKREAPSDDPRPLLLYPVAPTDVTLQKESDRGAERLVAEVDAGNMSKGRVPLDEMIWTRRPNLTDPYGRGKGIGHVISKDLEIDEFAAEFVRSFFHNDATPRGLLTSETKLSDDQRRRLKKQWNQRHRSASRSHQTAVLSGNDISYERIGDRFDHLNISELRNNELDLLRKVYGVPPEIIGQMDSSNRATSRHARTHMAQYTTQPRLRLYNETWANEIVPLIDDSASLVHANPVPEDKEHQRQILSDHPDAFTVNEIREEAGKPPREDGDVYLRKPKIVAEGAGDPIVEDKSQNVSELPDMTDEAEVVKGGADVLEFPIRVKAEIDAETPEEIARALQPEFIENGLRGPYRSEVEEWVKTEAQMLGVDPNFEILNPLIDDHVERFGAEQVTKITDTTKDQINAVVAEGFEQGKNPLDLVDDLDSFFLSEGVSAAGFPSLEKRAEAIARTEMLRASNYGRYQSQKTSGVVSKREWVSTLDMRVRPAHEILDQTVVAMSDTFEVKGEEARFPGDFGVAELDIQCRCTTAAKIPTRHRLPCHTKQGYPAPREMIWKQFDSDLSRSEDRFLAAVRETFRGVRRRVLRRAGRVLDVDVSDRIEEAA